MQKRSCIAVQLGVVLLLMQPPSTHAQEVGPTIGGCPVFPSDNIWNTRIDRLPVDPRSKKYVATIGATEALRADFGSGLHDGAPIGIPFATVPMTQPKVEIRFRNSTPSRMRVTRATPDQSDPAQCAHRGRPTKP